MSVSSITPGDWDWCKVLKSSTSTWMLRSDSAVDGRPIVLTPAFSHDSLLMWDASKDRLVPFNPELPDAQLIRAAPNLLRAVETAMAYISNVNAFDVHQVGAELFRAMVRAGYDGDTLAMSIMGAASLLDHLPQSIADLMIKQPHES